MQLLIQPGPTYPPQSLCVWQGRKHCRICRRRLFRRLPKPGLLRGPLALQGHGKPARRDRSVARQACQGGSFHARGSFCSAGAAMAPASANAQPAALRVVSCRHADTLKT
jgi:hypothetical protein